MKQFQKIGLLSLFSIVICWGGEAWSEPPSLQKSPADYAYYYDQQLPKPRFTVEEEALRARQVRQGLFARQLVRSLELESGLPQAASEDDCIRILNDLGISPLKGWDRFGRLTSDDYTVVMGKIVGKEFLVHQKAQEVCGEIMKLLNVEWSLYYAQNGRYPLLEKLITDKSLFPGAEPRCPYGVAYRVGGFKPQVLSHRHIDRTPFRNYLFKERDYVEKYLTSK